MYAGQGRQMVEFAARRTQGTDAANKLARVCYLTGFAGTSNVQAAALYGMPPAGTMAHSFITSFPSEREAFEAYVDSFPDTTTLLVDTYDTIQGTRNAIEVGKALEQRGHRLRSIRLDSGDLLALSLECRRMLDEAGLDYVDVLASGGLDEYDVEVLSNAGAPIAGSGVGTKLGVSADAPWTDCAYKLVEFDGRSVLKLSTGKETLTGRKQVWRAPDGERYGHDIIARADQPAPSDGASPLLHEVVRDGKRVAPGPTLTELRDRFTDSFARLPEPHKALRSPANYTVEVSPALNQLQHQVRAKIVARELGKTAP